MTDKRITDLVAITGAGAATNDVFAIVDVSATETKKITRDQMFKSIPSLTGSTAIFSGGVTGNLTGNVTGNASTATALQTSRTIGGVSFNGTANINLPSVNITGNQNTTGSAASLTTARTLTVGNTGKTFNGSADVTWSLPEIGVGTLGQQNSNSVTVTGGTINGAAIGGTTASSIRGTTVTATGDVTIPDRIIHAGDTDTQIRFPAADTVTVETNGAERLRVDSSGNVGIGTSSPSAKLQVEGQIVSTDNLAFSQNTSTPSATNFIHRPTNNTLAFGTASTERMRITSEGDVCIGTTLTVTGGGGGISTGDVCLTGPKHLRMAFTIPSDAGTFVIQIDADSASGFLDVYVQGGFGASNREGDAIYRVIFHRLPASVNVVTVSDPRNIGSAGFTTGYSFSVTKPNNNRLLINVQKSSNASYGIFIDGFVTNYSSAGANIITAISTSFS